MCQCLRAACARPRKSPLSLNTLRTTTLVSFSRSSTEAKIISTFHPQCFTDVTPAFPTLHMPFSFPSIRIDSRSSDGAGLVRFVSTRNRLCENTHLFATRSSMKSNNTVSSLKASQDRTVSIARLTFTMAVCRAALVSSSRCDADDSASSFARSNTDFSSLSTSPCFVRSSPADSYSPLKVESRSLYIILEV
jgi:hypothetical protein